MPDYRVVATPTPVVLDPDSFCPRVGLRLDVSIMYEAMPASRSPRYSDEEISQFTNDFISDIVEDLEVEVAKWIKSKDPYSDNRTHPKGTKYAQLSDEKG